MPLNRREFLQAAGAACAGATIMPETLQAQAAPGRGPMVVASANALKGACPRAYEQLLAGVDPVDAVVAGINLVEDDPSDHSVGLGGIPNEDGVVELDASVMHGPTHKGGAVASIQRIRNPSSVAALVMRRSDHVLLVGEGALRFAKAHGFREENLLTEQARELWLKWKENLSSEDDWLPANQPKANSTPAGASRQIPGFTWGTITCLALTANGDLGGCTSTSGLSYKIPGRVGDSPILGAGLYVDNDAGACGSTGRGEANLLNLSSARVVDYMKDGLTPEEACLKALRRVAEKTEPRLRDAKGRPDYDVKLYAVRKDGLFGGASLNAGGEMTVQDGAQPRLVKLPSLFGPAS